jgi:hypothetical protein
MRWIQALMLITLTADLAGAATLADKFKASVERKVAPPFGTIGTGKWKAFCVCNSTNQVGALESFNGIPNLGLTCTVPSFTNAGDYSLGVACYDWSPLTK